MIFVEPKVHAGEEIPEDEWMETTGLIIDGRRQKKDPRAIEPISGLRALGRSTPKRRCAR